MQLALMFNNPQFAMVLFLCVVTVVGVAWYITRSEPLISAPSFEELQYQLHILNAVKDMRLTHAFLTNFATKCARHNLTALDLVALWITAQNEIYGGINENVDRNFEKVVRSMDGKKRILNKALKLHRQQLSN